MMWQKIKNALTTQAGFYTGLFACLAVGGWLANGWLGKHFVIGDLMMIYGWIAGQLTVTHGINSVFNSQKGQQP